MVPDMLAFKISNHCPLSPLTTEEGNGMGLQDKGGRREVVDSPQ